MLRMRLKSVQQSEVSSGGLDVFSMGLMTV